MNAKFSAEEGLGDPGPSPSIYFSVKIVAKVVRKR
jgi:hypothetical protein